MGEMRIAALYSFNGGAEAVDKRYPKLLSEVKDIIGLIDSERYKTKRSKEKTKRERILYSPKQLNKAFKREFGKKKWETLRVKCDYPTQFYVQGYAPSKLNRGSFREMDFVKDRLGIEVQCGKYSCMVYNVAAKMTIFHRLGYIDVGIEMVPGKALASKMSSGVSYFEKFVWDLEKRGIADIDIPVLIIGIDSSNE